ncbi:MAG TPA: sarcosine oxidase subunit alpha family protein [Hyphomicrobiaceae bacterium]
MAQTYRRARGGRIDRAMPIAMRFNGTAIEAYAGDTIASALLANGIHFVARSFKYHRPRGIFSHGSEEPNGLFAVDRGGARIDPNTRASSTEAVNGLSLRSQNHWPSLAVDVGAVLDAFAGLLVAGFYYKTFMWPRSFWRQIYEPAIRGAAGLGRAPTEPDPDRYRHAHAHCEVLVVGAGPAGLAAALAASESDKRVILADEQAEMGGSLLHDVSSTIDGRSPWTWLEQTVATLQSRPNVKLLPRTTVFGYYNHNHLGLVERVSDHLANPHPSGPRERLWQVRAGEVVLATGAHERPLVFPGNDRPGIMLAESLRVFANRYGVLPGQRAVIVTSSASAYTVAAELLAAGVHVTIVDVRRQDDCAVEAAALRGAGCEVLAGHTVLSSRGRTRVKALLIAPIEAPGRIGPRRLLACDCVGLSGGWTPAVHLFSQSRGKLTFAAKFDAFLPEGLVQGERSAGAVRGAYQLAACLAQGWRAGAAAAGLTRERHFNASQTRTGFEPVRVLPGLNQPGRAFVDLQNDVTAKDIGLAVREGFRSIEHVKRYTTAGMATDQGKTSNMNVIGLVAETLGCAMADIGTTTFRPPYTPVTFGALAGSSRGRLFEPVRTPPTHAWAVGHGAIFEDVGQWKRARAFPRTNEDLKTAVAREARAVRASVGILDASTLGKIEVVGPDAAEFLDRLYTNHLSRLAPGRSRYALMLKEDGYIFDDGIVARLARDRFHVTTTTGGAARVLQHMEEYLQTEWPELAVYLTSTTEQYATIAVQGPKSRQVLAPLMEGIDLTTQAFPHMAVGAGRICGLACRLFRASFTGELGYEINVPADYGQAVWDALIQSGQTFGITPYGTEAMHVLRAEKGFIIVGQETDGTVAPDDLGLAGLIGRGKADFVGMRSLARPDLVAPGRKQLMGLVSEDARTTLEEGAQIVADPSEPLPMRSEGHVTSSYWSPSYHQPIALALIAGGRSRIGQRLHATTPAGFVAVRVRDPVFFDPAGARVHA